MTAPRDHSCPSCGWALPADSIIVDDGGAVRRECPYCHDVVPAEVTAHA